MYKKCNLQFRRESIKIWLQRVGAEFTNVLVHDRTSVFLRLQNDILEKMCKECTLAYEKLHYIAPVAMTI